MSDEEPSLILGIKPSHLAQYVAAFSVATASVLYFTGYEYLNRKAVALGLASQPFEESIHRTMAEGFSTFVTPYFFVCILIITLISTPIEFILDRIYSKVQIRDSHKEQWKKQLEDFGSAKASIVQRAKELKEKTDDGHDIATELANLDKETDEALRGIRRIDRAFRLRSFLSSAVYGARISLFIIGVMLLCAMWGGVMGELGAKRVRENVSGKCLGCLVYSDGKRSVKGLPVFQNQEGIFVAHKEGITYLPLDTSLVATKVEHGPAKAK